MIDKRDVSPQLLQQQCRGVHGDIRWSATTQEWSDGSFSIRDVALHLVDGDIRIRLQGDGSRYDSIDALARAVPQLIEARRRIGGRIK